MIQINNAALGLASKKAKNEVAKVYGIEDTRNEFKTSFVFPPQNSDCQDQAFNVFKAVCAMLNTDGGIVYIGVNDNGRAVVGNCKGIKSDMAYLHIKSTDAYTRYVRQKIDSYFKDAREVNTYVFVEQTDNENVITIKVKPATNRVFYLRKDGTHTAYMRRGANSLAMDKAAIKERENELARKGKEIRQDERILEIQKAIEEKKKITIYQYRSNSSGTSSDRTVEPITFTCDKRYVWAYEDANSGNEPLRLFKIIRMGGIRILEDNWEHESEHKQPFVDAFEWARPCEATINICMSLGVRAKNDLVERTPEANKYITDCSNGIWYLNAKVHSLIPVRSFCLSHIEDIEVYAPDEFRAELGIIKATTETRDEHSANDKWSAAKTCKKHSAKFTTLPRITQNNRMRA